METSPKKWFKLLGSLAVGLCALLSASLHAQSSQWIELEKAHVQVKLPDQWKTYEDILGMPLLLKGPTKNGKRAVIMITPTEVIDIRFDEKSLKEKEENYQKGRLEWLKKYNGDLQKFYSYKLQSWKNVKRIHRVGMRYTLQDKVYEEFSFYFNCKKQLFHVKALYPLKEFRAQKQDILNIVKSFNCRRKI